jgi:hypothetical protein
MFLAAAKSRANFSVEAAVNSGSFSRASAWHAWA